MWWPTLNDRLKGIQLEAGKMPIRQSRSTTEMVEELLELTRTQQREMATFLRMSSASQRPSFFGHVGGAEQLSTISAGQRLRALREALGLTMREVEQASSVIAQRCPRTNSIPPSRMSDIESKGVIPSVFRLYSLASIYRRDFAECFLSLASIFEYSTVGPWTLGAPRQVDMRSGPPIPESTRAAVTERSRSERRYQFVVA